MCINKFQHVSKKYIDDIMTIKQYKNSGKPEGLWFTFENVWLKWSNTLNCKIYNFEVDLDKIYNLKVDDYEKLLEFVIKYRIDINSWNVDWEKIEKDYNGIWFSGVSNVYSLPKNVPRDHNGSWIFSIDIDSGCLWNNYSLVYQNLSTRSQKSKWFCNLIVK